MCSENCKYSIFLQNEQWNDIYTNYEIAQAKFENQHWTYLWLRIFQNQSEDPILWSHSKEQEKTWFQGTSH